MLDKFPPLSWYPQLGHGRIGCRTRCWTVRSRCRHRRIMFGSKVSLHRRAHRRGRARLADFSGTLSNRTILGVQAPVCWTPRCSPMRMEDFSRPSRNRMIFGILLLLPHCIRRRRGVRTAEFPQTSGSRTRRGMQVLPVGWAPRRFPTRAVDFSATSSSPTIRRIQAIPLG